MFTRTDQRSTNPSFWDRLLDSVARRRVRISKVLAVCLLVRYVTLGIRPRGFFTGNDPWVVVGCLLVLVGMGIRSWAAGIVRKHEELSTSGPYHMCRNPLYVGSLLLLGGFGLLLNDFFTLIFLFVPQVLLHVVAVRVEERSLAGQHGASWADYITRVPRWFPRHWPAWSGHWSLSRWWSNREVVAILTLLFLLAGLEQWRSYLCLR